MNILIVNDDGINAKGMLCLAEKLSLLHNVTVVAPQREQSGTSHSLTFHSPLTYEQVYFSEKFSAYALNGSPCDCVKFGIEVILKYTPDLVISGINNMCNIGTDVLYSGTVNAAIEGSMMKVKSLALSLDSKDNNYDFACEFVEKNLEKLMQLLPNYKTIFSINFPSEYESETKGVRFTTTGNRFYADEYQLIEEKGYIITGHPVNVENREDSDVENYLNKFITIAPIKVDFNDYELFESLKDIKL